MSDRGWAAEAIRAALAMCEGKESPMPSDETWSERGRRLVLCLMSEANQDDGTPSEWEFVGDVCSGPTMRAIDALLAHYEAGRCPMCGGSADYPDPLQVVLGGRKAGVRYCSCGWTEANDG